MTEIMTFTPQEVVPPRAPVLAHQGVGPGHRVSAAVEAVWRDAERLFGQVAEPIGMLQEIAAGDFARVYEGEGRNEPRTPVGDIAPQADRLALFAVTLGPRMTEEIAARFEANDLALGSMLDSVASLAADTLAERLGRRYGEALGSTGAVGIDARALCYSPGYCGWDISGQGKLFEFLRPREIGITLRESFLMEPLKSVSGVVVVGPGNIHEIDMDYSCCAPCQTQSCRARIDTMAGR